jgi:hypothetical protein
MKPYGSSCSFFQTRATGEKGAQEGKKDKGRDGGNEEEEEMMVQHRSQKALFQYVSLSTPGERANNAAAPADGGRAGPATIARPDMDFSRL